MELLRGPRTLDRMTDARALPAPFNTELINELGRQPESDANP